MPQCTPVALDCATALLSLVEFEGEIEKDSLFAGMANGQPFAHPFVSIIFISSRSLNHQL